MYYPCIIHVLSMYYPCINYPCIIHVLIIHVLSMYYPCIVHVLPMYYPCITHVLPMYYPCITHVLPMYYPCITHVLPMYYPSIHRSIHPSMCHHVPICCIYALNIRTSNLEAIHDLPAEQRSQPADHQLLRGWRWVPSHVLFLSGFNMIFHH